MKIKVDMSESSFDKKSLGLGIHKVKSGNPYKDVVTTKKGIKSVLVIPFFNENGTYELTEWEVTPEDLERKSYEGKVLPSNIEHMILRINLILSKVNNTYVPRFEFDSFEDICECVLSNFKENVDLYLKLAVLKNKRAEINKYVAALNKSGKVFLPKDKIFIDREPLFLSEREEEYIRNIKEIVEEKNGLDMEDKIEDLPF